MPTDQRTLPGSFSTDADFRNWGSGLSAQFAAVGLVKTSDTGQIDWSTVLKPSGGAQPEEATKFGALTMRFRRPSRCSLESISDLAVGVLPFRVMWSWVGTGTNGAGTLTGQVGAQVSVASTAAGGVSYCSGSSSRLNLATNWLTNTSVMVLLIERTKTGAGIDTGDGVSRYSYSSTSGLSYQFLPFVGTIQTPNTTNPALDANLGGVSALGTDVMLSPTVVFYGKPLFVSWCVYKTTEITALTPISFTHLGATRTYLPLAQIRVSSQIISEEGPMPLPWRCFGSD
jgi:hypothetical protein